MALYALYRLGLITGHYRRVERGTLANSRSAQDLEPLLTLPSRQQLLRVLETDCRAALLKEADEITKGKVRLFGSEPVPMQLTFKEPLLHWCDYETGKARLPVYQSTEFQSTDPKFVWEPARFGWAFTLGRAYWVSEKEKYAEAFWKHFEMFERGNPPYFGPNWMNGQEVAIRLMALVWAERVFAGAEASTASRRSRLAKSVAKHATRILPTLAYARSQNNNHLLVEAAGLYTAGLALRDHPEAAKWRVVGQRWLNWCFTRQISPFGEYIQQSTNYHRVMLHVALWVCALSRAEGGAAYPSWLEKTSRDNLARAAQWLFSMTDAASGRAPNLGANDGALVLPLSSAPFVDYRPTVQAALCLWLGTTLPAGPWDELSLWLGLQASKRAAAAPDDSPHNLRGKNSWAYLRATSFKSRLSHMDQLHFDLWWRGLNIAQDAGTYLYNAAVPWDNPLVSTRVHNTVTVDGVDQMTHAGRFLTLDWCPAYLENVAASDRHLVGSTHAWHNCYRRLGVRLERTASVFADGHWEVKDDVVFTKPGKHIFRLHWLLLDGKWEIEHRRSGFGIRVRTSRGWVRVSVSSSHLPQEGFRATLVRGGEVIHGKGKALPFEGWASPTYGLKVPALSLALETTSSTSFSFISEFVFPR